MKERIRYFELYMEFSSLMWILIKRNQYLEPMFGTQGPKVWEPREPRERSNGVVSYIMIPLTQNYSLHLIDKKIISEGIICI